MSGSIGLLRGYGTSWMCLWKIPNIIETEDLLTIATIGGYASQALARARVLHHRITVAHAMQNAMLTTLPSVHGLQMAARYAPADSRENVGGDWYDAAPIPDADHPGRNALVVSAGDIIGHNLDAATIMGQVRPMLRQTAWDHPHDPPSAILRAFATPSTSSSTSRSTPSPRTHPTTSSPSPSDSR